MSVRHLIRTADQANYDVPAAYKDLSEGFTRWSIVNGDTGSVHQEFGICTLESGGSISPHIHSFEESFYILDGEVVCDTVEGSFELKPGDYGVVPVAGPHAWRNTSDKTVQWAEMLAPQPRLGSAGDTFPVDGLAQGSTPTVIDARDPRTRSFGHIEPENMDAGLQTQENLALSASMRTALLVYSGITVKMMVDPDLGASLQTMFMVRYEPRGVAGAHDHPFEESYFILEGEVEAKFDGVTYRLAPGDIAFAGTGCIHEFKNIGTGTVRWLETQAPQPPSRYSYRFGRDWAYLDEVLS